MSKTFTALGIDVGGTKIAAGLVEFPSGRMVAQRTARTSPERGGEAVLKDVATLAKELGREANVEIGGTGVGLCEIVDPAGRILSANCIRWRDEEVRNALESFGPVFLEADVRAAAQAEALFGAGREFRIFLYVTVGTGISSCLMIDGSPFLGAGGATGTMASSPVSFQCGGCGLANKRALEEIASGPALVSRYNKAAEKNIQAGSDVLRAAIDGDATAMAVVSSAGEALGSIVALLINVLDPEAVIVGGGVGLSEGLYWDRFVDSTRRHIWLETRRGVPIVQAKTGQDAGVIGAAAVAWKHVFTSETA